MKIRDYKWGTKFYFGSGHHFRFAWKLWFRVMSGILLLLSIIGYVNSAIPITGFLKGLMAAIALFGLSFFGFGVSED